ncbi:ATPase component of ABC transporter with duplicated ATPase domains [Secundilactobacillus pentosiphilus]|uniref:ATPase component of ABC transporter with duplicated ATPase domains n=1 Tax=Secundilactobacillus pentosiphilus TaxID=1714682 RepID=A0A1Z5IVS7_9LACO|nr:ATP-binding cassette domain-containing protein [Secundilactobacillus pentosiphilus]GAX05712.1 ATPase component of ABC transporter with duplicated ATPase domains [Secundilactobacillus pentosiphilus]
MSTIQITHLTFAYPGQDNLFNNQNLTFDSNWKLGLTGRNGRGKTTLLNLIRGKLSGQGTITMPLTPLYFPQPVTDPTQDAWAVATEASTAELWEIQRELSLMHTSDDLLYRPYESLSGGEQTKVLLAATFASHTGFPLLDEPTNHLDITGRDQIAEYLHHAQQGFIVISHDRHFLDAATDHTLTIEKQQLVLTQGNYSAYEQAKQLKDQSEYAEQAKLRHDIGRLKQTAANKRQWSQSREGDKYGNPHQKGSGAVYDTGFIGARSARVMQKAKNLEHRMDKAITDKESLLQNVEFIDPLKMNYQPDHHETLLWVRNVQLSYNGQPLFTKPVSFELNRGDRLALIGPNGSGKSSLIAAIQGRFKGAVTGEIQLTETARRSLVRQHYPDNLGTLTEFAQKRGLSYQDLLNNLKKLGMPRDDFKTPIQHLSADQQKKVELAASLATPTSLYLWDEPLNYLDVFNQEQLTTVIQDVQPTMLVTEHDRDFIQAISTKIVTL